MLHDFIYLFTNTKEVVESFFTNYGVMSYFLICLILFCETGLVFTPFLPGDSLLFAVGATIAAIGVLRIELIIPLMFIAVILGDNVNYFIGNKFGTKLFDMQIPILSRLLKREYLQKTEEFYEKHGAKTIILARFVPIVRTFAPFVAGVGTMTYRRYIVNCLLGGALWVTSITLLGYTFGTMPFIQKNFTKVILGIVLLSVLPAVIPILKARFSKK